MEASGMSSAEASSHHVNIYGDPKCGSGQMIPPFAPIKSAGSPIFRSKVVTHPHYARIFGDLFKVAEKSKLLKLERDSPSGDYTVLPIE
jgi:hypothetical protein